jgi:hypothetical protein
MPATSPYQRNDYQAVSNFRPYELPINDIYKALSAQNEFWDQGAARVKSVYDNALNLKLSLEPNKELRRKYMEDAEKQITKLSSMDLSDPSVQRQGFAIFKPIMNDEGIIYDDAMTRHFEKVRADALAHRTINNGKGFSDVNMAYALDGYEEFVNSKDRMAGKKFYQQRKDYEPFHDPAQEINDILKNCKPDKLSRDVIQGYYIATYSNEARSAAKVNSCMDAGLSDKARRQLEINGSVAYRKNPEALLDKYLPHLHGTVAQLLEQEAAIKGVLANKNNLKSLKPADLEKIGIRDASQITPEFIKMLEDTEKGINMRVSNLNTTIAKLLGGDLSPVTGEDYEKIAGTVFSRDYMENVGEGFSFDFTNNELKSDPIQMMFYQQGQQNARQEDQQQHEIELKQMQLDADILKKQMEAVKSGNLKTLLGIPGAQGIIEDARIMNDSNSPFSEIDKADSYEAVTNKRKEIADKRAGVNQQLVRDLRAYGLDTSVTRTDDARFVNFWKNFAATAAGDPEKKKIVDNYYNEISPLVALEDLYKNTQDVVDEQIKPILNTPLDFSKVPNVELRGKDGKVRVVTPQEMLDNVSGKSNSLGLKTIENRGILLSTEFEGTDNFNKMFSLYRTVHDMHNNRTSEIKTKRNEIMQRETVLQREGYNFQFLNDKDSPFKKRIAQELGIQEKYVDKITIGQTDLDGRIIIKLADAKKEETDYDRDGALEKLKRYGGRDNKPTKDDKNAIVVEGINDVDVIDDNDIESIMTPYVRTLESKALTSKEGVASTGFMRSMHAGRSYRLEVSKRYNGTFEYRVVSDKDITPVFSSSDRKTALDWMNRIITKKAQ